MSALSPADAPSRAYFDAPLCRNCGAALHTRFCGECGQEKACRFNQRAVGSEAWQNWRWFEFDVAKSCWRVVTRPGTVAREYVLGARKKHVHPLKLLLIAIGALLLVLGRSSYLDSADAGVSRAMELVRTYSNWSFSLGIIAILASSLLVFGRRGGYNLTEHLVLAVYCQFLVICASVLTKLPTLLWRAPEFLARHKVFSVWFTNAIGIAILAIAFSQFFQLDPRRDGARLLLACALFLALKWGLLKLYALAMLRLVTLQLA